MTGSRTSDTTGETAEEFADRIAATMDAAALAMLLSIGHQVGLLETLGDLPPATSTEIADAAGLNERYVREWLGGMAAADVVEYHPDTGRYRLPAHRAEVLTNAGGARNLAPATQYIPLLAEVEQKVIGCVRDGGGLSYADYPRFHTVMAQRSGEMYDRALVDEVIPLVDGLPERLRARAVVADFGCGSGHAINLMARAFPASTFTGVDFSAAATATGAAEAARLGLTNVGFVEHDLAEFDARDVYDLITAFDTIHDQARPEKVLANIHRALRPGGVLLMMDVKASSRLEDNIGRPLSTYRYTVSLMHCMSVSLGLDGAGLGTMWGHQRATAMLADAGFTDVTIAETAADPLSNFYIARR